MSDTSSDRWRVWPSPALLVVVACAQIALAHTAELSPWKGGGFGMFATIDGTSTRFVRLYVRAPDRSEEIAMQPSFERAASRARLFPSRPMLERLADAVAAREARYERPVTDVTVQVWRVRFESDSLRANDTLIQEHTFSVAKVTAHRR